MSDIAFRSAHELSAAIRRRELSSRELLDTFVDRVEQLNGTVNAVVTLDLERARAAATRADDALARDKIFGVVERTIVHRPHFQALIGRTHAASSPYFFAASRRRFFSSAAL